MFSPLRMMAAGLALASLPAPLHAAPDALTHEQMAAAVRTDDLSIPMPGEFMQAINKIAKLDWKSIYRPSIPTNFTSRPQMALNLGTLIADGYIAVEAEDAQAVKNVGRDITAIAKPLGVKEEIVNRGKILAERAENGQWDQLKEELEAAQNEVKLKLGENEDKDLIPLVTVGGWARGTQAVSSHVIQNYSEESARLLRQPGIVDYLGEKLEALPDKIRDDPAVKQARMKLAELRAAVSFDLEKPPTLEQVKQINKVTAQLLREISKRDLNK